MLPENLPGGFPDAPASQKPESVGSAMTPSQKQTLKLQALGLLNEQLQARIVHYKAEMQTSPELDAITAQVVSQLKRLQAAAGAGEAARTNPRELETEQARNFAGLLARVFSEKSSFATQVIKPVGRRVAKLFFESELHQKTQGDRPKTIQHAEQGVYYVLQRYSHRLRADLEGYSYASEDTKQLTLATLAKIERDLQIAFLSRRSPELNRVMTIFTGVLAQFLQNHLRPRIEELAVATIRAAGTAYRPTSVGYKIMDDAFPDFREEWERLFMDQMVNFCGDELLGQLKNLDTEVRQETIKFFTDPHVFSETGQVLCDSLYDYLSLEGFLDLPLDWRVQLARA